MILTDEAALRVKCSDVLPDEISSIREALEQALKHSADLGAPGLGLAAPQIGIPKRMAIVRVKDYSVDLVNCKIQKAFDKFVFEKEGCLSFPGRYEKTRRFQEVHVHENTVEPYAFIVRGLISVVVQHEHNHFNQILLPDVAIISEVEKVNNKGKLRPNDPCFCGSGKKLKKCCKKDSRHT